MNTLGRDRTEAASARRKRVLIADDFPDAAELLAQIIESGFSCDTECATDGRDAMNRATRQRPDAAIFDIDMPHLDGIGAARELRAMYPRGRMMVFAMSGGDRLSEASDCGLFDEVFRKPVDTDAICVALSAG